MQFILLAQSIPCVSGQVQEWKEWDVSFLFIFIPHINSNRWGKKIAISWNRILVGKRGEETGHSVTSTTIPRHV